MRVVLTQTAIILILSLLMYFFHNETNQWFPYYHNAIAKGEVWRLLTAHLCHTNGYHLLLNAIGLIVVVMLFADTFKKYSLLSLFIFSALFISLMLFLVEKDMRSYVGLSGVLHAFFAFSVCDELKKREKWGVVLALGFIIKIGWEQFNGPSANTEYLIGATVLVNAHLYGASSGIIYFLSIRLWQKIKLNSSPSQSH